MKLSKTLSLFVPVLALCLHGALEARPVWFDSPAEAAKRARHTGKPILMDVYAPWCPYCRRMQTQVYPDQKVLDVLDHFVRLRVNGENHPKIMRRYKIRGFPAIVFLDSEGGFLGIARGYHNQERLIRRMRGVLKKIERQKNILKELEGSPKSVFWNYRAGLYYYRAGHLSMAERHFKLASTQVRAAKTDPDARDALYNLAVVSMDQKNYEQAARYWTHYINRYPKNKPDVIYARYYRGITYYFLSNATAARKDLNFAAQNLPTPEGRAGARNLMRALSER